jgi:hypothetical protein
MFGQVLLLQLRWSQLLLASTSAVTFVLPFLVWRLGEPEGASISALNIIAGFGPAGPIAAVLSALIGFLVVAHQWNLDGSSRHVYALTLPVPWRRWTLMQFGAGVISILIPALALWLGALGALALIELPPTLQAYPGSFALRFLAGTLVAFSLAFALQHLAGRRAPAILLGLLLGAFALGLAANLFGFDAVNEAATRLLFEWPGPFSVYGGEWRLVDV